MSDDVIIYHCHIEIQFFDNLIIEVNNSISILAKGA